MSRLLAANKRLIQKLGLLGVLSFLSYTAAVAFSPIAYPGYNSLARAVSDYVHDGSGTAGEAVSALGFDIYQTQQTEDIVKWIRDFNKAVTDGRDIRFYGFDVQKYAYSYEYLIKTLKELGADISKLEELWDGDSKSYARAYTSDQLR